MDTILACVDFSDVTERLLRETRRFAQSLEADVCLLHVIPPLMDLVALAPQGVVSVPPADPGAVRERLDALAADLQRYGVTATAKVVEGAVAARILETESQLRPVLTIIGSHGHGKVYRLLVGSVAEAVLRRSVVPVLVVPSRTPNHA
jgi:nucleotide-binding universal stress UspA family protein